MGKPVVISVAGEGRTALPLTTKSGPAPLSMISDVYYTCETASDNNTEEKESHRRRALQQPQNRSITYADFRIRRDVAVVGARAQETDGPDVRRATRYQHAPKGQKVIRHGASDCTFTCGNPFDADL